MNLTGVWFSSYYFRKKNISEQRNIFNAQLVLVLQPHVLRFQHKKTRWQLLKKSSQLYFFTCAHCPRSHEMAKRETIAGLPLQDGGYSARHFNSFPKSRLHLVLHTGMLLKRVHFTNLLFSSYTVSVVMWMNLAREQTHKRQ